MIRVETYQGTPEDLAEFVGMVWSKSYAGKMVFPRWTPEYFRWQFRWNDQQQSDYLLAAYEGDTLVGVLLGTEFRFKTQSGTIPGAQWGWLSIHPDHRGKGIAKALDAERVHRHLTHHAPLIVSYRFFGSKHSQAEGPQADSVHKKFHSRLGNWVRVLDADRFGRWSYSRLEALVAHCTVPLAPRVRGISNDSSIREYAPDDLDACLQLIHHSQSKASICIDWNRDTLAHQLGGSPISQTLLLCEGESIEGLINFHILPFQSNTVENVGIIDLIALGKASFASQTRLIRTALSHMADQQVILVVKPRIGETPFWPLLRLGFAPQPDCSFLVFQSAGDPVPSPPPGPIHLLWR